MSIEDQVSRNETSFTDEYEDAIDVMKERVRMAITNFHKRQRFEIIPLIYKRNNKN